MNTRPWIGLILGMIIVSIAPLIEATNAGRMDEPWPMMFASEASGIEPSVAVLQQRAKVTLEKLVQTARDRGA